MSGRLSRPRVIVGIVLLVRALGGLMLVGVGVALLGCGSDSSVPRSFDAEQVAALPAARESPLSVDLV